MNKKNNSSQKEVPSTVMRVLSCMLSMMFFPLQTVYGSTYTGSEMRWMEKNVDGICLWYEIYFYLNRNGEEPDTTFYFADLISDEYLNEWLTYQRTIVGKLTIPETVHGDIPVKFIRDYAFHDCSMITEVAIPSSVTDIRPYAFANCDALESVKLPENMDILWNDVFINCDKLETVHLPKSMRTCGFAFSGCNSMKELYSYMKEPPSILYHNGGSYFPKDFMQKVVLYIPAGTRELYEEKGWEFANIVEMEMEEEPDTVPTLKGDVNGDTVVDVADISRIITFMANGEGAGTQGNLESPVTARAADVNGDGTVDVADISAVITIMAGKVMTEACPDDNHPHWIDLGLASGTQWRCCNQGASKPEAYGGGWWGDYLSFVEAEDAPSFKQIVELINNTTSVWTTQNGVNGRLFIGSNGHTIFLPAAGYEERSVFHEVGSSGRYWSSTRIDDPLYSTDYEGRIIYFDSDEAGWGAEHNSLSISVRPVRKD